MPGRNLEVSIAMSTPKLRAILTTLACALAVGAAAAQQPRLPQEMARQRAARTLHEIVWHNSLDEACAVARQEGRLVFWVHMLGRIDGAT